MCFRETGVIIFSDYINIHNILDWRAPVTRYYDIFMGVILLNSYESSSRKLLLTISHSKGILGQIPHCLMPLFQGFVFHICQIVGIKSRAVSDLKPAGLPILSDPNTAVCPTFQICLQWSLVQYLRTKLVIPFFCA